jgi:hypothetical protein
LHRIHVASPSIFGVFTVISNKATVAPKAADGAFNSPLALPVAGFRINSSGSFGYVGSAGRYWPGTVSGSRARALSFNSSNGSMSSGNRAIGRSVPGPPSSVFGHNSHLFLSPKKQQTISQ